jgi:chromosome segregation ATPase
LTQEVDALVAQAGSVGLAGAAEPLSALLADVARTDLSDPLSAAPGGRLSASAQVRLDGIVTRLAKLRDRVGALVGIRDGYPRRVAELRALVDQVGAAEERLAGSYARAVDRIADTGLPPAPNAVRVLTARLADLDRLHRESRWGQLVDDAANLERSATRARERAEELREAADGLLARRDELRGRLEAYRAKAATLGYAEDEELTALHTRARELLYTAPCDLRAATRATFAYQQALAARTTRPGPGGDSGPGGDDDDR